MKPSTYKLPLALIFPLAVMCPLNVCVSDIASPNIFEPLEYNIEDDTIDDVIFVVFIDVAVIEPTVILPVTDKSAAYI